ncbi:MAG: HEAT repeat domain-containing protein [Planctomycetes bacterium]|nr:HEAT repeat domain-containing protein [Planctomycetota bacterium]
MTAIFLIVGFAVAAASLLVYLTERRPSLLVSIAEASGLTLFANQASGKLHGEGLIHGRLVKLLLSDDQSNLEIRVPLAIPKALQIYSRRAGEPAGDGQRMPEAIRRDFNDRFWMVEGEPRVDALLSSEVCARLVQLARHCDLRLESGELVAARKNTSLSADDVLYLMRESAMAAEELDRDLARGDQSYETRLLRSTDHAQRVRGFSRISHVPNLEESAEEAVLKGLEDPDFAIRFASALAFRRHGGPLLRAALRPGVMEHEQRAQIVELLAEVNQEKELLDLLRPILEERQPSPGRIAAVRIVGSRKLIGLQQEIVGLSQRADVETATACIDALSMFGGDESRSTLRNLLTREDPELASKAAEALGLIGTVEDVEPLLSAASSSRALAEVARRAVAQIQSRLPNVERGGLALGVDVSDAGKLSSADDHGMLSEAPKIPTKG